ncbi:hypothetical protein CCZ01_10020, partial [Helicobacter monodelphidis]|uniref:hypothetical protein n=1 Tax=Helicobacter sp. 15-1451 TaxID=2004995 RepID=UPI000DCC57B3
PKKEDIKPPSELTFKKGEWFSDERGVLNQIVQSDSKELEIHSFISPLLPPSKTLITQSFGQTIIKKEAYNGEILSKEFLKDDGSKTKIVSFGDIEEITHTTKEGLKKQRKKLKQTKIEPKNLFDYAEE